MKITNVNNVVPQSIHGGTVKSWRLFQKTDFLGNLTVFNENVVDPGMLQEPHQHEDEEQFYFILSGIGLVTVGEEKQEVKEGDAVYLPPKLMHSIKNVGSFPLRMLMVGAKI
jgi:mannose-6-phosphate isomerase-like protein (cupin superfamily)